MAAFNRNPPACQRRLIIALETLANYPRAVFVFRVSRSPLQPRSPSSCSVPGLAAAPGGLRGTWELQGGHREGALRTRILQAWAQRWLENGSLQLLSPPFPFSMKDNSFGIPGGVKALGSLPPPPPVLVMLCWTGTALPPAVPQDQPVMCHSEPRHGLCPSSRGH